MLLTHADDFNAYFWKFGERPEWWGDWTVMWEFTDQASRKGFVTNSLDQAVSYLDEEFGFRPPTLMAVKLRSIKPKDRAEYRREWRMLNDHRIKEAGQRELFTHCPRQHMPGQVFELPTANATVRTHNVYEYLQTRQAELARLSRIAADDLTWLTTTAVESIEYAIVTNPAAPIVQDIFVENSPDYVGIPPRVLRRWAVEHGALHTLSAVDTYGHHAPRRLRPRKYWINNGLEPVDVWTPHSTTESTNRWWRPPFESFDWKAGEQPDWWASRDHMWEFEMTHDGEQVLMAVSSLDEAVALFQLSTGHTGTTEIRQTLYSHCPLPGKGRPGEAFALPELSASVRVCRTLPYLGVRYQRNQWLQARVAERTQWVQGAVGLVAKRHAAAHASNREVQASIFDPASPNYLSATPEEAVRWSTGAPLDLIQLRDMWPVDHNTIPTA